MAEPETCVICGVTREEHGDYKHQFSLEDEDPFRKPPKPTPEPAQTPVDLAGISLRLVAVLSAKGVLNSTDVEAVLRGKVEPPRPD